MQLRNPHTRHWYYNHLHGTIICKKNSTATKYYIHSSECAENCLVRSVVEPYTYIIFFNIVTFCRTRIIYYYTCEMWFSVSIALGGSDTRLYCFYYFLNASRASWHIIPSVLGHYRTMVSLQCIIYRRARACARVVLWSPGGTSIWTALNTITDRYNNI